MKRFIINTVLALLAAFLFMACSGQQSKQKTSSSSPELQAAVATAKTTAENSIYQLTGTWTNRFGKTMTLPDLQGEIRLVAMIYTSCGYACPKMVHNMKMIQQQLPADLKDKVGFVLFTFDREVDTPERLSHYAATKELGRKWTLLRGTEEETRTISMLLNTQYRAQTNGMFSHSNILTVLNKNGTIYKQFKGLDINPNKVIQSLAQLN